jgi:negative regulator of sigma E activity
MKVEILTKSRVGMLLVAAVTSAALFAQSSGPGTPQSHASALDVSQIVSLSVAATERSWQVRDHYTYTKRDEDRRLDSLGHVKSENIDVTSIMLVNGARFEQIVEHNGQVPSAKEQQERDADLGRLKHETPQEKTARLGKDQENRSFLQDVVAAFDFHLVGEERVAGRLAYVLHATPHPGYHAHGKYGKMISRVEGKLWIDEQDFGWIKVDGQVTESFSIGLFVARVQQGSHVILEQTCVGDAVWVPKRLEVRASARILFLKSLDLDRILTYSDYRLAEDGAYSVSR